MPAYATRWLHVAGRRVKVATGRKSQTFNICTSAGAHGQYEQVVRLTGRFVDPDTLERLAFETVADLVRHLEDRYHGVREGGRSQAAAPASWMLVLDDDDGPARPPARAAAPASILEDVPPIFDRLLGCAIGQPPCYRSRSSYLELDVERLDGPALIEAALAQVNSNLAGRDGNASVQNWRWRKNLEIADHNSSREKQLEKAIARHGGGDWVNQVPTSSGVMGSGERHRNIDLVERTEPGCFRFVELKVDSDTPLSAAVEIVCYGLIYLASRRQARTLGYAHHNDLLRAESVELVVLAPASFYRVPPPPETIRRLEAELHRGICAAAASGRDGDGPRMGFRFEQFPDECAWDSREAVLDLLARRK